MIKSWMIFSSSQSSSYSTIVYYSRIINKFSSELVVVISV